MDRAWNDFCDAVGFFKEAFTLPELFPALGEVALEAMVLDWALLNPEEEARPPIRC